MLLGEIESQTETRNQYKLKTKQREKALRPATNISRSLGDMDFTDHEDSKTIFIPCKPVAPIKAPDNFKPFEEGHHMQETSESKNQYKSLDKNHYARKVSKIRPSTTIKNYKESGQDWSTVHGSDFFPQSPIYKKNTNKKRTNLMLPKGKFETMTHHREKYIPPKPSEKASKLPRPTTSIKNRGHIDFKTIKEIFCALVSNSVLFFLYLPLLLMQARAGRSFVLISIFLFASFLNDKSG